jgi:hypothetical protein
MIKRFADLEPGALFRTREGGSYQKLPNIRPDGFLWFFANTLNVETRRFAYFGDHVFVREVGHEPLEMQDGMLRILTEEGTEELQFA